MGRVLERATAQLSNGGARVTSVPTTGPGTASHLARECVERGADLIVAVGGDGTINEVVNGIVHSPVPLGILPAGTANVLAVEMGISKNLERALDMLGQCVPETVSLGLLRNEMNQRGRYFLMMAGVGLDAHIIYNLNANLKSRFGKVAYWIAGFSQLGRRFAEFDACVNGDTHRSSFALASRVRNYGGDLQIAPSVSLLEPDFEVVLFAGSSSLAYLKYFAAVLSRRIDHMRGIEILRTSDVLLSGATDSRVYVQVDGEYAGHLPATVHIEPNALTLLVPPEFRARSLRSAAQPACVGNG